LITIEKIVADRYGHSKPYDLDKAFQCYFGKPPPLTANREPSRDVVIRQLELTLLRKRSAAAPDRHKAWVDLDLVNNSRLMSADKS
jgi:hypothetical protein